MLQQLKNLLSLVPSAEQLKEQLPVVEPRKRLDIAPHDLLYGIRACATSSERERNNVEGVIARVFRDDVLCGLCVRALWDALLSTLKLPRQSVVLFTGINIQDMVTITEAHGLKAHALDVDDDTLLPCDGEFDRAMQACGGTGGKGNAGVVKVLLLAHLFGARNNVKPLIAQCRQHGVLFVEDLAEAWAGPRGYLGDDEADCCLFSFGTIKTSTALGGAVARVRNPVLREQVRVQLGMLAVRPASVDAARFAYYLPLNQATHALPFGALVRAFQAAGVDHDEFIRTQSRGFDRSADLFAQMRLRPSVALLKLLARRLCNFDESAAEKRRVAGAALRDLIQAKLSDDVVSMPGDAVQAHEYWLFPVVIRDNAVELKTVCAHMLRDGFDVTSGTTQLASLDALVMDPLDPGFAVPERAKAMMNRVVYLPLVFDEAAQSAMVTALASSVGVDIDNESSGSSDSSDSSEDESSSSDDDDAPVASALAKARL